jgi:putative phage-type endonuclease
MNNGICLELEQGTAEWLKWRDLGIGGSDAAAIMGSTPYMDVLELYNRKLGLEPPLQTNAAMQRGHDLEPIARVEFELETGLHMKPGCFIHPEYDFMRASLDGISADGKYILEIKCPGLTTHREALTGKIKPYYFTQMQHCMAVTATEMCYYCSYTDLPDIQSLYITEIERDDAYIERMIQREAIFWDSVVKGRQILAELSETSLEEKLIAVEPYKPNPLVFAVGDAGTLHGDTRKDPAWGKAVEEVLSAKAVLADAQAQYESRLRRIEELMQRKKQVRVRGAGVLIERSFVDDRWCTTVEEVEDEME